MEYGPLRALGAARSEPEPAFPRCPKTTARHQGSCHRNSVHSRGANAQLSNARQSAVARATSNRGHPANITSSNSINAANYAAANTIDCIDHDRTHCLQLSMTHIQKSRPVSTRPVKLATLSTVAAILLSACGEKIPDCSDEQTTRTAIELIRGTLREVAQEKRLAPEMVEAIPKAIPLEMTLIRTTGNNQQTHTRQCAAKLVMTLPESFRQQYAINQKTIDYDLEYTAQFTDDKKALVVSINNANAIAADIFHPAMVEVSSKYTAPVSNQTASRANELDSYVGKHPNDAIKSPALNAKLKQLLAADFAHFERNIDVAGDMQQIGNVYFGSGNAAQLGTIEEAAFAVDKSTGKVYAALLREGKRLNIYGENTADKLPDPLRQWVAERSTQ